MSSLYKISERLLQALEMAESDEYSDDVINNTLDAIEWELEEKADNYAKMITVINGEIETAKKEKERIKAVINTKDNIIKRLKYNLQNTMDITGKRKFKTDLHSFRIQNNPPSVEILNEKEIPGEYYTIPEPIIKKVDILKALKSGVDVPGVELRQTESLRIS